jgi:hypothetical protein
VSSVLPECGRVASGKAGIESLRIRADGRPITGTSPGFANDCIRPHQGTPRRVCASASTLIRNSVYRNQPRARPASSPASRAGSTRVEAADRLFDQAVESLPGLPARAPGSSQSQKRGSGQKKRLERRPPAPARPAQRRVGRWLPATTHPLARRAQRLDAVTERR